MVQTRVLDTSPSICLRQLVLSEGTRLSLKI